MEGFWASDGFGCDFWSQDYWQAQAAGADVIVLSPDLGTGTELTAVNPLRREFDLSVDNTIADTGIKGPFSMGFKVGSNVYRVAAADSKTLRGSGIRYLYSASTDDGAKTGTFTYRSDLPTTKATAVR